MSDEQQAAAPVVPEVKSDVVSINSDNMQTFYDDKLGLNTEPAESVEPAEGDVPIEGELVEEHPEEPEPKEEKSEKPKKKNSFQERISEVTAEKNAAKEEAQRERQAREALEARIKALETPKEPVELQEQPQTTKKPDISTYTDVAKYEADLTAYNREMFQAELRAENAAKAQLAIEHTWEQKKEAFMADNPDYEEVVGNSNLQISNVVKEAIVESDIGPHLVFHLANNPEIVAHLKTLSLASQAREIGKIEASLAKPVAAASRPSAQASKAPQPISPIKGVTTTDNKIDANGEFTGTPDEYRALRKAGKIK